MGLGRLAVVFVRTRLIQRIDRKTYKTFQGSNVKTLEDLAGLITVPNILECLGGVLSADVEKNLLSTSVDVLACGPLNEFEVVGSNSRRRVKLGRMVRLSC